MSAHDRLEFGSLTVERLVTGAVQENTYLIYGQDRQGFVVDPGADAGRILAAIENARMQPRAILLTHAHFDHIGAVEPLRRELGLSVYLDPRDLEIYRHGAVLAERWNLPFEQPADPDGPLTENQVWQAGDVQLTVRPLPGHAPGHVVLLAEGLVLAGDTLFAGSIGRTDLPGGDLELLLQGIRRELLSLPDRTWVLSGHGPQTTVGHERLNNSFLT